MNRVNAIPSKHKNKEVVCHFRIRIIFGFYTLFIAHRVKSAKTECFKFPYPRQKFFEIKSKLSYNRNYGLICKILIFFVLKFVISSEKCNNKLQESIRILSSYTTLPYRK
jgi:hypothetical protein